MEKKYIKTAAGVFFTLSLMAVLSSCTLFGLKKQTDFTRTPDTIDAHVYKNAWQYIKSRGLQSAVKTDTPLALFQRAILYSGIDTNEYIKQNRTYVCLNAASCKLVWANFFPASGKAAKGWNEYAKADLVNYLSYLIVNGQYSHYNLPVTDVSVQTLAPAGTYSTVPAGFKVAALATYPNTKSNMLIRVFNSSNGNTSDYPLFINLANYVYTSDLLATNGVIQVMNTLVSPAIPQ